MNPAVEPALRSEAVPLGTLRIRSIDIFRGLTMLVMIFVNDLAGVKGLPWWTYHMPGRANGMTYVDVVFPAFLFILGMAIPLAVNRRLEQGDSPLRLALHVLTRALSLIVLGLVLANASKGDPQLMDIAPHLWAALAVTGAILFRIAWPREGSRRTLYRVLEYGGLALLVAMLAVFRRSTAAGPAWLDFRYWEILGLIGRVYLAVCILYVPLRRKPWAPAMWFVLLTAFGIATRLGLPSSRTIFPYWVWPFDNGELPSIAMAGVVAWSILIDSRIAATLQRKMTLAFGFTAILFAGGWGLAFLGISKNRATPTWCLYSAGISMLLITAIYWLADVRGHYRWAAFLKPAGSNTLLTYLLPDLFYFLVGFAWLPAVFVSGWPGVVRSVAFTGCMLALAWVFTRMKLRMQL